MTRASGEGQRGRLSRRDFMGTAAAAMAAVTFVPRHVLGGPGNTPPSEKLNIAGVGIGGMGQNNVRACESENIVALCDVDWAYSADVFKRYPKARAWKDYRKMLDEQTDIDAVIVATPDHTHAVVAMAAMQRGKHVYVQKPLTRSVHEARMLTEAARKYKVATQMGNQGHSSEEIRMLCEWIWDGAIGNVHEVHCWTNRPVWPQGIDRPKDTPPVPDTLDWDLWVGPSPMRPYHPAYLPFNWRAWIDFGAGALGDMGCHVMDAAFWALKLKYPVSVEASHSYEVHQMWTRFENKETYPSAEIVHYQFPAREGMVPVKLHWYDGGLLPERPADLEPGRRLPESGSIFVGDKGKILCGTYSENARIIPEAKMRAYTRPAKSIPRIEDGPGGHEQDWVRACKGGPAASANFGYSGPFTETVVMGNLAVLNPGKKLEWDGENMKVTNDEEANAYVRPAFRDGWSL
ncbi:Gfo/Idh/MocA family protein [Anaerobaca lacustris]|uniref:Gfo/Idh/MocA family oxidoreductase n=1 Tax=Anaerobaca lacustris TaxID=3044600 RepID=A0AAW6TYK4_9BACT|nr:Gfo/Idh/MocA family oxidoreductase [Sedimentisphaerales bacterium M17dextr]